MRIFISWSGEPAKRIAEAGKAFFHTVLAGRARAFVSSQDIEKGARGGSVLTQELGTTDTGLLVLTSQNQDAPWALFEAGALSKSLDQARVVPLLVDLEQPKPTSPLAQFQRVKLVDREDVERLVIELSERLPEPVPQPALAILFEAAWPAFESVVTEAVDTLRQPAKKPTESSILETILDEVRGVALQQRRLSNRVTSLERAGSPKTSGPNAFDTAALDALRRRDADLAFLAGLEATSSSGRSPLVERAIKEAQNLAAEEDQRLRMHAQREEARRKRRNDEAHGSTGESGD